MSQSTRHVLALIGAVAFTVIFVHLVGLAVAGIRPAPVGTALDTPEAIKAALEAGEAPVVSLLLLLGGWLVAGYFGGQLTWRWSQESSMVWVYAAVLMVIVFRALVSGNYPTWLWLGGMVGAPLFALGGGHRQISVSG